jgi:porin
LSTLLRIRAALGAVVAVSGTRRPACGWAAVFAVLAASSAVAQDGPPSVIAPAPTIATSLPAGGDPWGTRRWLAEHGVTYAFVHTTEMMSNLRGGIRRGTIFDGKLEAMLGIDLGRAAGLEGLSFYANMFQLHGSSGPGRSLVGNLNTISNIEALATTRLSEIWLEQKFWDGKASLRAGQLVVDTEFLFSQYFSFFVSSDWPTNPAVNIPNGGAAYPLSTPGVRLKLDPTPQTTALLAVYNGDPAGQCGQDAERCNRHGLNFRVNDPPYVIGELQYRYNQDANSTGLAGGVRLGAWHHFGKFDDLRFDINGFSLADPASFGVARSRRGNDGVYVVYDQQLYRPPGADANTGILFFTRAAYSTPDRSLNDFYLDAGLLFAGMIPSRPQDVFGASFLYSHISDRARGLDLDTRAFTGLPVPVRDYELSFDISYGASIVPGWMVQPFVSYVIHPGGNIAGNNSPLEPIKNTLILGARSTMRF